VAADTLAMIGSGSSFVNFLVSKISLLTARLAQQAYRLASRKKKVLPRVSTPAVLRHNLSDVTLILLLQSIN
jgi:hypothetical protein